MGLLLRRYYGLLAQRFCQLKREYQELFQDCFRKQAWSYSQLRPLFRC